MTDTATTGKEVFVHKWKSIDEEDRAKLLSAALNGQVCHGYSFYFDSTGAIDRMLLSDEAKQVQKTWFFKTLFKSLQEFVGDQHPIDYCCIHMIDDLTQVHLGSTNSRAKNIAVCLKASERVFWDDAFSGKPEVPPMKKFDLFLYPNRFVRVCGSNLNPFDVVFLQITFQ